ncbi:hypothetical protein DPMN_094160 [Dreissena polymorpha]|uniref:Uncharacterized protein n=1 Tax=Dreissena polymorpha TaxID=45954 RepID=A0A9D4L4Z4_DREPO|nr:hypothetical protein DPMN_094160 [Dreissena polymorpha]
MSLVRSFITGCFPVTGHVTGPVRSLITGPVMSLVMSPVRSLITGHQSYHRSGYVTGYSSSLVKKKNSTSDTLFFVEALVSDHVVTHGDGILEDLRLIVADPDLDIAGNEDVINLYVDIIGLH